MELPQLPPINVEEYRWKESASDPGLWQRRGCGCEALVGVEVINTKGEWDLFFSVNLAVKDKQRTLKDVDSAAKRAWKTLRFHHPEIACTAAHDGQIKCLLQYRAPKDDQAAQAWAESTINTGATPKTAMDTRDESVERRRVGGARSADAVVIHITADLPRDDVPLGDAELRMLFHSNHLYFDGIGIREMIGAFLKGFAAELGNSSQAAPTQVPWHESAQNLPLAVVELMNSKQSISGPAFDEALKTHVGAVMRGMGSWGLETQSNEHGKPSTVFHTLPQDQSQKIIRAIKSNLGTAYTITHLTNAAILLALLKTRPPPPKAGPIHYAPLASVQGRRFMTSPYSSGQTPYFPCSQTNGALYFSSVYDYVQPEGENDEKTKELLAKGAAVAKECYVESIGRQSVLGTSISIMELIATMFHSMPPDQVPKMTVPNLASDGIDDRYITHEYFSNSKQEILSVKDVNFWVNMYSENPMLRLSSWRGCAKLSLDFNSTYYSPEDMQGFLTLVVGYMVTFAS